MGVKEKPKNMKVVKDAKAKSKPRPINPVVGERFKAQRFIPWILIGVLLGFVTENITLTIILTLVLMYIEERLHMLSRRMDNIEVVHHVRKKTSTSAKKGKKKK